ncbi:hypothetical protein [Halopiger thermotolerans]
MTTFTADDIGKRVESATGEPIGSVVNIDRETAYVDPTADAVASLKAVLDWDGGTDTVPLADDAVGEITDEAVRLEAELPAESVESNIDPESGDESAADPDADESYSPGTSVEASVTEPGTDQSDPTLGTEHRTESSPEMGEQPAPDEPAAETEAEPRTRTQPDPDADAPHHAPEQAEPAEEFDPMGEMEDSDAVDPETEDPLDETTGGSGERADDLESVEEETGRDLEVDPSELTEGEPEAEIRSREDVGDRTDAEVARGNTTGVDSETERPNPGEPGDEATSVDTTTEAADESGGEGQSESEGEARNERSESDADEQR